MASSVSDTAEGESYFYIYSRIEFLASEDTMLKDNNEPLMISLVLLTGLVTKLHNCMENTQKT